jgi:hypothetical protein
VERAGETGFGGSCIPRGPHPVSEHSKPSDPPRAIGLFRQGERSEAGRFEEEIGEIRARVLIGFLTLFLRIAARAARTAPLADRHRHRQLDDVGLPVSRFGQLPSGS